MTGRMVKLLAAAYKCVVKTVDRIFVLKVSFTRSLRSLVRDTFTTRR